MNEYCRGFEDALDLVKHRGELQEIIDRVKESKIIKIERELGF